MSDNETQTLSLLAYLGTIGNVTLETYAIDIRGQTSTWRCAVERDIYGESRFEIEEIANTPDEAIARVVTKVNALPR